MFFAPEIFLGCAPKILDRHYKIWPITDHRAKFHAGRPTHLGDLARKEKKTSAVKQKSFRKPSFSGGLINPHQPLLCINVSASCCGFNFFSRLVPFRFTKANAIAVKGRAYYVHSASFLRVTSRGRLCYG